ncbi:endogenous retrovirus group K member 19 Env polyprotein-like [Talpa occidentalis]|uniref:endogenous retrovirus group K member 19 Env polyprotein-like n=1 Tax=Talpa occidentalis TaxID=50954 RepID=UPI0023FA17E7|nr:endogenous retrovirus group K member 19 Env polyprotein-like [Talpa occidentalis]
MPTPLSGFRTDSSATARRSRSRARAQAIRHRRQMARLTRRMRRLQLLREHPNRLPTWGHIKALAMMAEHLVQQNNVPRTALSIFMAIIAILATQSTPVQAAHFWAYVPEPPFLHPVPWTENSVIKVYVNDTNLLGGLADFHSEHMVSSPIDYDGLSDDPPLCAYANSVSLPGCMMLHYVFMFTDAPPRTPPKNHQTNNKDRVVWDLTFMALEQLIADDEIRTFSSPPFTPPFPNCVQKYRDVDQYWDSLISYPVWLHCGFSQAMPISPLMSQFTVYDFSFAVPTLPYRRFSVGWVPPMYAFNHHNKTYLQPELFRLFAAFDDVIFRQPGQDTAKIPVRACVGYPFALLLGNATATRIQLRGTSYSVHCSGCVITNCITPSLARIYPVVVLLKRPPYVMLPVDLHDMPWYDNTAMQVLDEVHALLRPKRFIATLILGIAALISLVTSLATSSVALIQETKTASFVNDLTKNVTMALSVQRDIDYKLERKINALEEIVIAIGDEVQLLKQQLSTRCHVHFRFICVTPLRYNSSLHWNLTKHHLLGIWHDNDLSHDLASLQSEISAVSKSHLDTSVSSFAHSLASTLQSLTPTHWYHLVLSFLVLSLLVLLLCLFIPFCVRSLHRSIYRIQCDMYAYQLRSKIKGGPAAPPPAVTLRANGCYHGP